MLEINGNLVELAAQGKFDLVIQCCNCWCNMGSGIALAFKKKWPAVADADKLTRKGDRNKLGTHTLAYIPEVEVSVVNLYAQFNYGRGVKHLDEDALRRGLEELRQHLHNPKIRIGTYRLGCTRAGGDWAVVKQILDDTLGDLDLTIVVMEEGE